MEFLSVLHSDVGIRKKTNQDSVLIKEAMTDYGRIMLAVICDGMGGLAKGEIASASLIRAFLSWFEKDFPEILYNERNKEGIRRDVIEDSLNALVLDVNKKIAAYAQQHHITMGTTAAVLLAVEGKYYTMNIGDNEGSDICSEGNGSRKDDAGRSKSSSAKKCIITVCRCK